MKMKKFWSESLWNCLQFSFSCIADLHISHFVLDILPLLCMRIPLHCFQTDILTGQTLVHHFFSKFLSQCLFLIFRPLSSGGTFWPSSSCSLLFLGPSLYGFFFRTMGSFICLEWSVIVWLFFLVVVVVIVIVIVIFISLILLPFLFGSLWCAASWSCLRGTRMIWSSRSFYFFTCILESSKFGEIITRIRDFALQLFEEQTSQTPYATISTKNSRN